MTVLQDIFASILEMLGLLQTVSAGVPQNVPYAGMDKSFYPGDAVMAYLHGATNIKWTGAYLDSPQHFLGEIDRPGTDPNKQGHNRQGGTPGHPSGSWMTGAAGARAVGFGILPIYWGQQDPLNSQGPWDQRAEAGVANGNDAIAKAGVAALAPHTVIYLDYESSNPMSANAIAYCKAWFATIQEAGFRPGLYAHFQISMRLRQEWPDLFAWIVNPTLSVTDMFVIPRIGATVHAKARDPGNNAGTHSDRDAIAWQCWFSSLSSWPTAAPLTFPAPAPMHFVDGSLAFDAAGVPKFDLDGDTASTADPSFPESANAPGLVRRGKLSAAIFDVATLSMFAVRRGALITITWTKTAMGIGTSVPLPDHRLAYNPWSPHASVRRGTSSDLAIIARSTVMGTADNAWQLHAYRRRAVTWTFDANINGATPIEPLLGVQLASRAPDTVEAFFVTNDGTHRIFAVSCIDATMQADGQVWSTPVEVRTPVGGMQPSLVGGIGTVSRAVGTVDMFVVARIDATYQSWQLFWNSSSAVGIWPSFSVPGDPTVIVHPFSNVAAVSRVPQQVDVFAIAKGIHDRNWTLYWWWWNQADSWGAAPSYHTQPIAGATVAPHPVSKVAAASRSQQSIDVFVVGNDDGLLYNASWNQATGWSDFNRVGSNAVNVGSVDGAFSRAPNSVDVIVTGRDGNVYVSSWDDTLAKYSDLVQLTSFNLS